MTSRLRALVATWKEVGEKLRAEGKRLVDGGFISQHDSAPYRDEAFIHESHASELSAALLVAEGQRCGNCGHWRRWDTESEDGICAIDDLTWKQDAFCSRFTPKEPA